jgi:hypothetical protein
MIKADARILLCIVFEIDKLKLSSIYETAPTTKLLYTEREKDEILLRFFEVTKENIDFIPKSLQINFRNK